MPLNCGYILMHFVLIAADNFQNLRIMEISSQPSSTTTAVEGYRDKIGEG